MQEDQVDKIIEQWHRERADLDVSPMGIIGRVSRISRRLEQRLQDVFSEYHLNAGEFDVLATLRRNGPPFCLTPTELFQSLMVTSGTMTNRIDQLEKKGLVERQRDPDDRRGVLVVLTQSGRELVDRALKDHVANEKQLLSTLANEEQQELVVLLRKLLLSLESEPGP
jgi:DNA-binding MarR family transcriptional regulator